MTDKPKDTTNAERQRRRRQRLAEAGRREILISVSPETDATLAELKSRHGLPSDSAAIEFMATRERARNKSS